MELPTTDRERDMALAASKLAGMDERRKVLRTEALGHTMRHFGVVPPVRFKPQTVLSSNVSHRALYFATNGFGNGL